MDFDFNQASSGGAILQVITGLNNLMYALRNFSLALALIFIIIGGIKFATSSGDPEKVAQAKSTITWAIMAMLFALALWMILFMFASIFGISSLNSSMSLPDPNSLINLIKINNPSYYKGN